MTFPAMLRRIVAACSFEWDIDRAAKALGNLLDLRVQVGYLGVGRLGRYDVHELILPVHVSPSGQPSRFFQSLAALTRQRVVSS